MEPSFFRGFFFGGGGVGPSLDFTKKTSKKNVGNNTKIILNVVKLKTMQNMPLGWGLWSCQF